MRCPHDRRPDMAWKTARPPGKSCDACRERHRACDRAKPVCTACRTHGLLCERTEPALKFVHSSHKQSRQPTDTACRTVIDSPAQALVVPIVTKSTADILRQGHRAYRVPALDVPSMTEEDFRNHAGTLLRSFVGGHAMTTHAWSLQLRILLGSGYCFDLAITALSLLRLSQSPVNADLSTMSLTAYNHSIRIFHSYLGQCGGAPPPMLTVLAIIFALYEYMRETPHTILDSGLIENNSHIQGAIALMRRSGPTAFQHGGYHFAFKKAREVIVRSIFRNSRRFADEEMADSLRYIKWSTDFLVLPCMDEEAVGCNTQDIPR